MIPYNAQGVAPFLLHPVYRPAAISALQGDRFTATLGTDLLEVTYEVTLLSEWVESATPLKHAGQRRRCATCSFQDDFSNEKLYFTIRGNSDHLNDDDYWFARNLQLFQA